MWPDGTVSGMAARRDALVRRRAAMGFTQEALAQRLGLETSTVGRWERGTMTPQPWNQADLAEALKVSPEQLTELLATPSMEPPGHYSGAEAMASGSVRKIRAAAQAFQIADRRVGGGVLYPAVVQYLNREIGPCLLDPGNGPHGSALFAAAASMTEIAGWMSHDSGDDDRARQHFDRAFRLAKAANHETLAGNACASMAHLAIELDRADAALRIAAAGLDCTPDSGGTRRLVARLHSMRARAFALVADRSACIEALDLAERTMRDAQGEKIADWIAAFDEASLASEAALCFMRLADYPEAERRAKEVVLQRSGDRVRSRAFGQLTLAHVLLRAGRVDEAASLGREVCHLTMSLSSVRVAHRLNDLARAAEAVSNGPEVTDFVSTLRAAERVPAGREGQAETWPV